MKLISHRGNITGPTKHENDPEYIKDALVAGYDCEIDVWYIDTGFYLGHDLPTYKVKKSFLTNSKLWCHAKNFNALHFMLQDKEIHCFWHEEDDYTITSRNFIWAYPGKQVLDNCIIVDNSKKTTNYKCAGVCSDYVESYKTYNI